MSHAVIAFGRMNPPTTGHEKLIHAVHKEAKRVKGHAEVIASHSHDNKKNPVPQDKKISYIKKVAPKGVKVTAASKEHPTIFHHAARLHKEGHTHLTVMSDKSEEWGKSLKANNDKPGKHGHYNFKSITMKSSGHRDPKASGTEGMSGTKMREHAKSGDHKSFKAGLPKALHPHAKEIMKHINEATDPAVIMKGSIMKLRNVLGTKAPINRIQQGMVSLGRGETVRKPAVRAATHKMVGNLNTMLQNPQQANRILQMIRKNKRDAERAAAPKEQEGPIGEGIVNLKKSGFQQRSFTRKDPRTERSKAQKTRDKFAAFNIDRAMKSKGIKPKTEETVMDDQNNEFGEAVMDIKQRIKRKLIMRRHRPKLKRMKKLYAKRKVPTKNLVQRARKAAIRKVRVKTTGKRGANYNKLSAGAKMMVDKTVAGKQRQVNVIAKRLLPKHRKAEIQRLSSSFDQFVGVQLDERAPVQGEFERKNNPTKASKTKHNYKEKTSKRLAHAEPVTESDLDSLFGKSVQSGWDFEVILEVFMRGIERNLYEDQTSVQNGFGRVNSFINEGKAFQEDQDLVEEYKKPAVQALKRYQARKSDSLRSKQSVSSKSAAMFKKRHGGKGSGLRPGTKRTMGRSSSARSNASATMRPKGGVTKKHKDLSKYNEHDFRRIHGISKSAMRSKLRREDFNHWLEETKLKENVPVEFDTNIIAAAANKGKRKKTNNEYVLKIGEKKDVPSNPYMKLDGTPEAAAHAKKVTPGQTESTMVLKSFKKITEAGMPSSVIKHKESLANLSDKEFHAKHGDKDKARLVGMARRHGYKSNPNHYVDRASKGSVEEAISLNRPTGPQASGVRDSEDQAQKKVMSRWKAAKANRPHHASPDVIDKQGNQIKIGGATVKEAHLPNKVDKYKMTYDKHHTSGEGIDKKLHRTVAHVHVDFGGERVGTPERVSHLVHNSDTHKSMIKKGFKPSTYGSHETDHSSFEKNHGTKVTTVKENYTMNSGSGSTTSAAPARSSKKLKTLKQMNAVSR